MKVLLKNMQKEEHTVELSGPQATVGELALKAEAAFAAEGGAVTLVHLGNVLNDKAKSLADIGVVDGGLVVVVLKKAKPVCFSVSQSFIFRALIEWSDDQVVASVTTSSVTSPQPASASHMDTTSSKSSSMLSLSVVFDSDVRLIEVESDETIENIKAILEVEYNLPLVRQVLSFEGKVLDNSSRLSSSGVKTNDMLMLHEQRPQIPRALGGAQMAPVARPSGAIGLDMLGNFFNPYQRHMREAEELLQLATVDPHLRRRISENNANLAAALESNNPQNVAKELAEIDRLKAENEAKKQAAIMRLNSNPMDVEAQREIEEAIQLENIDKNLEQVSVSSFDLVHQRLIQSM
jgi:hypothetical protein